MTNNTRLGRRRHIEEKAKRTHEKAAAQPIFMVDGSNDADRLAQGDDIWSIIDERFSG